LAYQERVLRRLVMHQVVVLAALRLRHHDINIMGDRTGPAMPVQRAPRWIRCPCGKASSSWMCFVVVVVAFVNRRERPAL
jgi:hypothetical protein